MSALGDMVPAPDEALRRDGWAHEYSGKVRDLWSHPDRPGELLMVASDRVSAFDYVLEPDIPGKGALLTALSRWWFTRFPTSRNHLVADERASSCRPRPPTAPCRPHAQDAPGRVRPRVPDRLGMGGVCRAGHR